MAEKYIEEGLSPICSWSEMNSKQWNVLFNPIIICLEPGTDQGLFPGGGTVHHSKEGVLNV